MSSDSINLGRAAVQIATHQGYIDPKYKIDPVFTAPSGGQIIDPFTLGMCGMPIGVGHGGHHVSSGGGGNCGPEGVVITLFAVAIFSGVIATTATSKVANDNRIVANKFNEKEIEAEKASNSSDENQKALATNAAKIFGAMSTENRIRSVAHGFFATGFALLTAVAIAAIAQHCNPSLFDHSYLIDGALGGAGFLVAGALTYYAAHVYKEAKREELETSADLIKASITNINSNGFAKSDA